VLTRTRQQSPCNIGHTSRAVNVGRVGGTPSARKVARGYWEDEDEDSWSSGTSEEESTSDKGCTLYDVTRRRVATGTSSASKVASWHQDDGWSSSGPEVSARVSGAESDVSSQRPGGRSDASDNMYEQNECSDQSSVKDELAKGEGQLSDAGQSDAVYMAYVREVHHYTIGEEPSDGEESWPNEVGQDEEGQQWTYYVDDVPCADYPDCETTVEHWRECDSPDFYRGYHPPPPPLSYTDNTSSSCDTTNVNLSKRQSSTSDSSFQKGRFAWTL
jgi:hypothetical protein